MKFSLFLTAYFPDAKRDFTSLYKELNDAAIFADKIGFDGIHVPEHHFINLFTCANPLIWAAYLAKQTRHVEITTSVLVLPLMDMRRLAGEIGLADILCEGRLSLGMGRGAFPYEFERYNLAFDQGRDVFDESLNVLIELLTKEDVAWRGTHYNFPALTTMPRCRQLPHPPIAVAAVAPTALYHLGKRGFNAQTTALQNSFDMARKQVDSFKEGAALSGSQRKPSISMLRLGYCAATEDEAHGKLLQAYEYYRHFDNMFKTSGSVGNGRISAIDIPDTLEEVEKALLVGTPSQMIDKLAKYEEVGLDEITFNMSFGFDGQETLDSLQRFAEEVMPHFSKGQKVQDGAKDATRENAHEVA